MNAPWPIIDYDDSGYRVGLCDCPLCGGSGQREILTGYDARDGSPKGYTEPCSCIDGQIEVEMFALHSQRSAA